MSLDRTRSGSIPFAPTKARKHYEFWVMAKKSSNSIYVPLPVLICLRKSIFLLIFFQEYSG
jgi:hypothetical protein